MPAPLPDLQCLLCGASTPVPALTCHACGEATWAPHEAPAVADAPVPVPVRPPAPPQGGHGQPKRRPY